MVDDLFSWLVPWSIDGCWRLVVISIPIAIILGYRYRSWKKGLLIGYMIWTLTILETLLDVGFGFYLRKPEFIELIVKLMLASSCAGVGALSGYIGTISLQGVIINTTTKKLLAFIVLFVLSSGLIIISLLMLPSPVKHDIMQSELEDLILQHNGIRLTTNPGPDEDPRWSTDGKKIIFVLRPDVGAGRLSSNSVVAVMDADGRNKTQLTNDSGYNLNPVISPDGGKIVYMSRYPNRDNYDIWVVNNDGSNKKRLTFSPTIDLLCGWSFDGKRIVYITLSTSEYIYTKEYNYDEESEIWIMDADGSDKELLLSIPYAYGTIDSTIMSPDGSKMAVVFDFYKNYRNSDIYLIDVPVPEVECTLNNEQVVKQLSTTK